MEKKKIEKHIESYTEACERWEKQLKSAKKFAKACGLDKKAKAEAKRIWREKMKATPFDY